MDFLLFFYNFNVMNLHVAKKRSVARIVAPEEKSDHYP